MKSGTCTIMSQGLTRNPNLEGARFRGFANRLKTWVRVISGVGSWVHVTQTHILHILRASCFILCFLHLCDLDLFYRESVKNTLISSRN